MNKFGRMFATDMDAEQSHVVLPKDQFQKTAFIKKDRLDLGRFKKHLAISPIPLPSVAAP